METQKAVVIGTGAGGLAATAHLAREGLDVVALEQADRIGGWIAPFDLDGYEFSPGVHYLGQCYPGGMLYEFFEELEMNPDEMFIELDPDGFDVYDFPDLEISMCSGFEAYRDRLVSTFPKDVEAIDEYMDLVRQMRRFGKLEQTLRTKRPSFSDITDAIRALGLGRWMRATYGELLEHVTDNHRLRSVLAGACGDYGLPPSKASAFVGLSVFAHYLEGAFYPKRGAATLRDGLVELAEESGVTFRTESPVRNIEIEDDGATAVELADGETIEADVIVSAIDPTITYGSLLPARHQPMRLRTKVAETEPSLGTIQFFIGIEGDVSERGIGQFNRWSYPWWDIDALYSPLFDDELGETHGFFLSSESAKVPQAGLAPEGCSTLEIVTFAPFRPFQDAARGGHGERGEEYAELKEQIKEDYLAEISERYPDLLDDMTMCEVSTPLTIEHYVSGVAGGAYGPAETPEQSFTGRFSISSPIPNLFLAGSGTYGGGVTPCLLSGRSAARAALKYIHRKTEGSTFRIGDWLRGERRSE